MLFVDADEIDESRLFLALDQYPQVANGVVILGDDSPEIVPLARDAIGKQRTSNWRVASARPSSMVRLRTWAVSRA